MQLSAREQRACDLIDRGMGWKQLAKEMGISGATARNYCNKFRVDLTEDRRNSDRMEQGSEELGEAVNAAGGHR